MMFRDVFKHVAHSSPRAFAAVAGGPHIIAICIATQINTDTSLFGYISVSSP